MIDFPNNPTVGQQFTIAGATWIWDGVKWAPTGSSTAFLPLAGGTLTGPLTLASDPTVPLGAATAQYADRPRYGDNRVINGDMRIDQRGVASGAGVTAAGYTIDRWQLGNNTGATRGTVTRGSGAGLPANGFGYTLNFASSAAYTPVATDFVCLFQVIEADMLSDLAFGTSNAQPITLSFLFGASQAGTYGGTIRAAPGGRSYPFTFNFTTVGVWQKIIVNIPGDVGGTWVLQGNAGGMIVTFDLGSGANLRGAPGAWVNANLTGANGTIVPVATNGFSYQITGVKLEIGSVATPFNHQSLAKSMADCQRYYQNYASSLVIGGPAYAASVPFYLNFHFQTAMRTSPTVTPLNVVYTNSSGLIINVVGTQTCRFNLTGTAVGGANATLNITADAEL